MKLFSATGFGSAGSMMRRSGGAVAFLLVTAFGSTAWAEPTDEERAGARAAAYAGVEAFDAGRWQEAVDYFERAESIIHSPVHLTYIGRARTELGQLVLAREAFLKVLRGEGTSRVAVEARETAARELQALEPRIPSLAVHVEGADGREFQVTIDDKPLASALVGIPSPVDPGERHVVVTAGAARAETTVDVLEGSQETATLVLPASAGEDSAGAVAPAVPQDTDSSSGLRIGSYVALGVGAVGLGAGTFFLLRARSKNENASSLCEREVGVSSCSGLPIDSPIASRVQELDDDARGARTFATVGFIAGGVGVATGVTLLLLSRGQTSEKTASGPKVSPVISHNYVGLNGTF